jgi:hypothetical protein
MSTNNSVNTSLLNQTGTGAFVGSISPTITTPVIAQINDVNGNPIFGLSPITSAVNYLRAVNQVTGQGPILQAIGTDINIPIVTQSKGISPVFLQAAATGTNPAVSVNSGTSYQHGTNFVFADTANNRTVTFQDADGTVAFTSDISSLAVLLAPTAAQTILTYPLNVPGGISTSQIFDTNGNIILSLPPTTSAVNYIIVNNNASGQSVALRAAGTDPTIGFQIIAKGTDPIGFYSQGVANPIIFNTGTTNQHITNFAFANTSATQTVTFPDATGTVQLSGAATLITAPAASQASSLALGTAFQNTLGYDVVLTVYLAVASATTANILLGVGPTTTPTQQTIVNGLSLLALGIIPVTIYLPTGYYALLSTTGTISVSISGQQIMPV